MWQTTDGYPNDNFYELRYKCGNSETVTKFNSLIDAYELVDNLRGFLASCSWTENQIKSILKLDEDEVIEEEGNEEV